MQLVRNTLVLAASQRGVAPAEARDEAAKATNPDLDRKLQEMKLAISLEKKYRRTDPHRVPQHRGMGGNSYGVQAGAEQFFTAKRRRT